MPSFIPDGKWKGTKRRNHCLLPSRGCQLSNRDRRWSTRKTHLLKNSEWRDALVCQTQTWVALSLSASLLLCPVSWERVGNLSLESLDSTKHSISKFQLVRCEAGTHVVPDSKGWAPRICPQIYIYTWLFRWCSKLQGCGRLLSQVFHSLFDTSVDRLEIEIFKWKPNQPPYSWELDHHFHQWYGRSVEIFCFIGIWMENKGLFGGTIRTKPYPSTHQELLASLEQKTFVWRRNTILR